MNIIEKLNWRYATKKFDSNYKMDESEIETVKTIIQLSPASFGLQPYKVLIITNKTANDTTNVTRKKFSEISTR